MTGLHWTRETIAIRKRGIVSIMVGRPRKIGKRERNGRMQRVYNRDDNPLRDIDMVLDNPTAIYVTEAGALSKIGISTNPQARARDIQVGNGQIVRLVWYRWMNGNDARRLEHAVHKAHRGSTIHAHGEWYYLSTDSAIDLVVSTIEKMNLYSIWERYSAFVERSPADRIRRNLPNPGDGVFR